MSMVSVHEAKTHLSRLLKLVEAGEEVVISRAGKPVARLVSVKEKLPKVPGHLKGKIVVPDDFDDPLPEEFWTGPI